MQTHEAQELPDWLPDWVPRAPLGVDRVTSDQDLTRTPHASPNSSQSQTPLSDLPNDNEGQGDQFNIKQAKTLYVSPNANRTVNRKLKGIHVFVCLGTFLASLSPITRCCELSSCTHHV
ncbi:hypothetical protein BDV10DRAFT_25695 [Aspergillus recurvatus]